MNIVRENLENLTSVLTVTVSEGDYTEAVDKALREYKRKANVPGFRPGMVPMGVVNKMYRKGVVAEEAYKTASDACFKYLEEQKIDFIGDVIPSDSQKPFDFENNTEHEFIFEFALTPEVKLALTAKDKVAKYGIKVNKEMHDGYRANYMRRFGRLVDVDKVADDEALEVTLDNEDMNITDAYVGLISMEEAARKPFKGKKVGDVMDVDINELYKTPAQRASVLHVKENELEGINPKFKMTITKIRKFADPELNEEFFKMAFPEGNVTDEKGLDAYIDEQIAKELARETEYLLNADVRDFLIEKANLTMPADFLKKWLFTINEGKFSMGDIEKEFDQFLKMMSWNVIQKHYTETLGLKVENEDMINEAKGMAQQQFVQYGMASAPDDMLTNYAQQILSNKEEARKIYERLIEKKVIEAVVPMIKIDEKSVSVEEFGKIVDEKNKR